jgi:Bacterial Ig-like domain (group 1)./Bacterial Ig-like domain (group 2).
MRTRAVVLAVAPVLVALIAACGGGKDSTSPDVPVPTSISIEMSGDALPLDAIGATTQLTATVKDQHGALMAHQGISFKSANTAVASVSTAGLVAAVGNGSTTITASSGNAKTDATITVTQLPHAIVAISGDEQTGVAGQPLAAPIEVQVSDRLSHPVAGVLVAFGAAPGHGSVTPASATTDSAGKARATWTTDTTAGTQSASAVVAGLDTVHFSATATPVPEVAIPASLSLEMSGDALPFDALGATTQLTATVRDQNGVEMAGQSVSFESANTAVASVNSAGLVAAVGNGTTTVTAKSGGATGQASIAVAQKPHTLAAISGDQQSGETGQAFAEPLVARVSDRLAHPVAGVQVTFAAASGSGSVTPTSVTTNAQGQAQTTWTAGTTAGSQSASAVVTGLSTLHFTASVHVPALSITPDTLIEGGQATVSSGTFDAIASNNSVTIDGVSAQVLSATTTSITFRVPAFTCMPPRMTSVEITSTGLPNTSGTVPIRPATLTSLAVGEELIVQDPTKFCFQFAARTGATPERYLMGFSMPSEFPGVVVPFRIVSHSGAAAPLATNTLLASTSRSGAGAPSRATSYLLDTRRTSGGLPFTRTDRLDEFGHMRAEMKLRAWETEHVPALAERYRRRMGSVSPYSVARSVGPAAKVGDVVAIKVPKHDGNLCTQYTTIQAKVQVIGAHAIWVTDESNPTEDPLTVADIQNASSQFDNYIFASDTKYFGVPSDIDGNGRVVVVFTREVNRTPGLGGFVTGADLFAGDPTCPASNGGEIYYSFVPDPNNLLGGGVATRQGVLLNMKRLIAHEVTHIIQLSRRYILTNGSAMHSWEMEGQATLAEELAGDEINGYAQGQNLGSEYIFGNTDNYYWFSSGPLKLMDYLGSGTQNSSIPDAPDLCSVYATHSLVTACDEWAYYGASWALQRYILDQYGPTYPGGITQLTKDWISKYPTQVGTYNVAAVLGVDYDRLFVRFATAIALDDLQNTTGKGWVPGEFSFTSWDLQSIASYMQQCCKRPWLKPPVMTYASDATLDRSVRGGSTAYTAIEPGTAEGGASFLLVDRSGNTMSTSYKPLLWVVRIQ